MIARSIKLLILSTGCLTTIVLSQEQRVRSNDELRDAISISEVRGYRQMFRVNEKPIDMVEETKAMCAPPVSTYAVHYDPGVVYYINEIARQGLNTYSQTRLFPVGSIIVKEKQERRTEDSVQIITVMKKVLPSGAENSWDYKMYDTKKWKEIASSRQGSHSLSKTCIECHRRYKSNDYVSDKGIELLLRR